MSELTPDEKHEFGLQVGETIVAMFNLLAKLDNIPVQDVIDTWIEAYVAERIIKEAGVMAEPKTEIEKRLDRIELAITTMASWLVQAQTGFGVQDAEGIEKILRGENDANNK